MSTHNRIYHQEFYTSDSPPGAIYVKSFWTDGSVTIGVEYPSKMMAIVTHLPSDAEKTGEWEKGGE